MAKTILIIDDDPDAILFLSTVLTDHGYRTVDAHDGEEGLTKAKSELPDLILLDLMMPQKSGIALLSDLKKEASLKEIPVIMVTGVAGETGIDLDAFFERSAAADGEDGTLQTQGYVEKPVDPQKLLRLVRKVLD
jgi:two-component system alkaline phosphatase synthesis response regulator PhoP